ncbi:MAG: MgtC/SapB family protein [Pseudomonadales bacterium]|nr:MgtC/SapB family protein [Pseudomonadales bacterium]
MDLEPLLSIAPYDWPSIITSVFCGTIIGLERQLRGKPVGIRTSSLITLGTYIFVHSALVLSNDVTDPSRVVGQVITGIGFLGAGVMLAKDGAVVGVTSAATIWVLAAVGVCISIGSLLAAIKLSLISVAILYGVDLLENHTKTFSRGVHAKYIKRRRSDKL